MGSPPNHETEEYFLENALVPILPEAYELTPSGLSNNIYENTDLVYYSSIAHYIKHDAEDIMKGLHSENEISTQWTFKKIAEAFRIEEPIKIKAIFEFPPRSGLASASALLAALSAALVLYWQKEWDLIPDSIITTKRGELKMEEKTHIFDIALKPEAIVRKHATQYGDFYLSRYIGSQLFVSIFGTPYKGGNVFIRDGYEGPLPRIKSFRYDGNKLPVLIVYSGGKIGARSSVDRLAESEGWVPEFDKILHIISEVAKKGRDMLRTNKLNVLGKLLSANNKLLSLLGQTSDRTEELVQKLENRSYGSRVVGYEEDGCVIALIPEESRKDVEKSIEKPARVLLSEVTLNVPGVKIEHLKSNSIQSEELKKMIGKYLT